MGMCEIDIKYLDEKCKLVKGSKGAMAFDFRAHIKEPVTIKCGEMAVIPLGFCVDTKEESVGVMLFVRSGMARKHGLTMMGAVGIIDSDYRGELHAMIHNTGVTGKDYVLEPYERCGQLMFMRCEQVVLNEVSKLNETERANGGFGSTGVN